MEVYTHEIVKRRVGFDVSLPGSKSITNRVLLISALARGKSKLSNFLFCDDTHYMSEALQRLGISIEANKANKEVIVEGKGGLISPYDSAIYTGNSGTTMRFLVSLLFLGRGEYTLDGDKRMRKRPIGDLVKAFKRAGAKIKARLGNFPPVSIYAPYKFDELTISLQKSSQYLTSILLSGAYIASGESLIVNVEGSIPSQPYINLTLQCMKDFGINVENDDYKKFTISANQRYFSREYMIEADASAASYFASIVAVLGGEGKINIGQESKQGDIRYFEILEKMGCEVVYGSDFTIVKSSGELHGIEVDMKDMPDVALTLAVVALFAKGNTVIRGLDTLKYKESDRLKAIARELTKIGAKVRKGDNCISITPAPDFKYKATTIDTYNDHRIAMSFAIATLKVPGLLIANPSCVNKTFPDFFSYIDKALE